MIELEPEVAPPAPRPRRHHRLVVAGATLLALLAGGLAVASGGSGPEAGPLALMATNGGDASAEQMSAAPAANGGLTSADSALRSFMPYSGGWGLDFEVEGDLPELSDRATAWKAAGPALDRGAVARIAGALGLAGSPVERDGGWWVEAGDWTLTAFPGETWSVNVFRGRFSDRADGAANDAGDVGPALSRSEAEARVRDLIDRMGAPAGTWKAEVTDTEVGIGWACAAPLPGPTDKEVERLEAGKLRHLEQQNPAPAGASGSGTAPAPTEPPADVDADVAACPPPPAPALVKGFNVTLFPLLEGRRADWPVWSVTLRSDGRIESLDGSWLTFERAGDHRLRGVGAALKELQDPPAPEPFGTGGAVSNPDKPAIALDGGPAVDVPALDVPAGAPLRGGPAVDLPAGSEGASTFDAPAPAGAGSTGSAGSATGTGRPLGPETTAPGPATPAVAPTPPVWPCPMAMPVPADQAASSSAPGCPSPEPQVVTITGVELGLIPAPVWENDGARLHLVPAYRFTGRFQDGSAWETSMIALHPDAIAPPPDLGVRDLGTTRDAPTVGRTEPAAPPPAADPVQPAGR